MENVAVFENLREQSLIVAERFREIDPAQVVLLHHNDSDGLTSGAILAAALERQGTPLLRYCLEKPYPLVLKQLFDNPLIDQKTVFIFADFASGMLPTIASINDGRYDVFIIDHHEILDSQDPSLQRLNCIDLGIDGSSECSASSVSYAFATALAKYNSDLLPLALIGGRGDGHFTDLTDVKGVHQSLFEIAVSENILEESGKLLIGHSGSLFEVSESLDALGSFGYFTGGTDIGIKGLLEGFDTRYHNYGDQYRAQYQAALDTFLVNLQLEVAGNVCWFELPDSFNNFGVKTVGLVCNAISETFTEAHDKYVLGFQAVPNKIPGIGDVDIDQVKFSLRVGKTLRPKVLESKATSVKDMIIGASKEIDLFVDACHKHAGAATVAPGLESKVAQALSHITN